MFQEICNDTIKSETFERSIYIGLVFCSMYMIVGFLVDFLGKKIMLIVVLAVTGLCGIGAHLAYNQQLAVVLFAIFQMSGACIGLMNAVAVEIFPTKYRYFIAIKPRCLDGLEILYQRRYLGLTCVYKRFYFSQSNGDLPKHDDGSSWLNGWF